MAMKDEEVTPVLFMGLLFLAAQLIALVATNPFHEAGVKAFENPNDPTNVLQIILVVIVFTAFILLIA
ncbi:MAG: hypothetical protein DRN17_05100, partial [Thermoplasmata archaeon]